MQIFKGFSYLIQGAKLLIQPNLRVFVLLPLLVNVIMFSLGLGLLVSYVSGWMDGFVGWLPSWLSGITWFLWTLFFGLFAMAVFWGFNLLANFIAAPFNGLLAEKVEQHLTGHEVESATVGDVVASIPRSIGREISKLSYYLPRVVILLIISFIPGLNVVAPWLWLLFGAWMMAIQYVDYAMDNNGVKFRRMKQALAQQRLLHLGFGGGVSLLLMVPVVNFFVMPIAVAGATALYVNEHTGLNQIDH
ncbi:MAG TPA: sulfate transporter CysZ [Oceanospirillaceae bacterium]|jgi:CysZ protein|nr:sulfate transporter CysZ [Oceanospirillaceae bacterium]